MEYHVQEHLHYAGFQQHHLYCGSYAHTGSHVSAEREQKKQGKCVIKLLSNIKYKLNQ